MSMTDHKVEDWENVAKRKKKYEQEIQRKYLNGVLQV